MSTDTPVGVSEELRSAEDIPLAPYAEQPTKEDSWLEHQPAEIVYRAPSSRKDVSTFFNTVLSERGWELNKEFIGNDAEVFEYLWIDSQGVAPYRLRFHLTLEGSEPTRVSAYTMRLPYAGRVPQYPDARNVKSNDITDEHGFVNRITVYTTNAQLTDLERFYRENMAQYGWEYGSYAKNGDLIGINSLTDGLHFNYPVFGPEDARFGGLVEITATDRANGSSEVRIDASGTDLPPESQR
jgi:hypothetical protein